MFCCHPGRGWSGAPASDWTFRGDQRPHSVGRIKQVLVIGGGGVLGSLTAGAFGAAGWTVRSAARRPHAGQIHVDLNDIDSILAAANERELVVNTVPATNLLVERVVLERGG